MDPTDAASGVKHDPALLIGPDEKHDMGPGAHSVELPPVYEGKGTLTQEMIGEGFPTDEELDTLRRVSDKIPWSAFTIAFVELCERFSYYGTTVVFTNFIQRPLPPGSTTGAGGLDGQAGALGLGQRASTGLTTFNSFWVYCTPLLGAYIADTYLGRYNTVCLSLAIAIVGHIILVASAAPSVLETPNGALGCFIVGIIIMGVGTGGFKPNISPLVVEQLPRTQMEVTTDKTGERVIVDPTITSSRVYHYFYLFINIGALVGQIGMTYSEKFVGFWLAYFLPTVMLCVCPIVLIVCRKQYVRTPPSGSIFGKAMKLFALGNKGRWSINPFTTYKNLHDGSFWEGVKPSKFTDANRPKWMTFDDAWVDEVARGFAACSVFLWYPLYWLAYGQLNNNLTSQAATMKLNGLPNDILSNLNPFSLIILIPIVDMVIYPALRKRGINFSPIKKITAGFFIGSAAMIWACVVQHYIYQESECGFNANDPTCKPTDINVWAQSGSYVLVAVSEILASITSLEYAFSKAPKNMRSLVMAFALSMNAISSAVAQGLVGLSSDPLLVWNYGVVAVVTFVGGIGFWFCYRDLDRQEDQLNMLPTGNLGTKADVAKIEEGRRLSSNMPRSEGASSSEHVAKEKL